MRRHKQPPKYVSEAVLCADLITHARAAGFLAYPETGGWDVLLVRHGTQIGVQAKLQFTTHLVAQALADQKASGPHYRALACPVSPTVYGDAEIISYTCRLLLFDMSGAPETWLRTPRWCRQRYRFRRVPWRHYRWHPPATLWLPPAEPDVPAGVPSPSVVGPWQLALCALEARCRRRGWVSIIDAEACVKLTAANCHARTLLVHYYECTPEYVVEGSRARRWIPHPRRRPASKRYPAAWKMTVCAAKHPKTRAPCTLSAGHEGPHHLTPVPEMR